MDRAAPRHPWLSSRCKQSFIRSFSFIVSSSNAGGREASLQPAPVSHGDVARGCRNAQLRWPVHVIATPAQYARQGSSGDIVRSEVQLLVQASLSAICSGSNLQNKTPDETDLKL